MKQSLNYLLFFIALTMLASCTSQKVQSPKKVSNEIKVMSYNVHHCNPPDQKNKIDVDAIAAVIKAQNADVVALQEIDVNTGRSGKINQAELLAKKASYPSFYFAKAMDFDGGQYGLLILSKHPLTNMQTIMLPRTDPKKDEPRVLALATVNLANGKSFQFGSTHLEAYNKASRLQQIQKIQQVASQSNIPFIVAGDFNDVAGKEVINILDQSFTRTCQTCPNTFDEEGESGAIDFIAFKKGSPFEVKSHQVLSTIKTSDHFPLTAILKWK
ncbi:MAG: endonuclease/exonuclease/phosphatase [Chitinophagaceae bacterium]|nr:MAG: endonuclease/exonuclease/phosphatase [Chitinophagaceae bacterium]